MAGRVLLVEDDAMIREDACEILAEAGYEVVTAEDGRDALCLMRSGNPPAVVLLDLKTPGLDGWGFRREQLADPRLAHVPVVLVSGVEDLRSVAATLKVAGYLRKPYGARDILAVVAKYYQATSA